MKNQFLGLILLICKTVSFAAEINDAKNGIAVISGHGEVLPDGVVVTMNRWDGMTCETVAADTISNGNFRLEVPVGEGFTIGSIKVNSPAFPSMIHYLYLIPGAEIEIDAVDNLLYTWPVESNVPEQSEYDLFINNSKEQWTEYQKGLLGYYKKMTSLHGVVQNQDREILYRDFRQKSDSLELMIRQRDMELLKTLPVGTVWLDKALELAKTIQYLKISSEDMKTLYNNLEDSVKNSQKGRAIHGYLYPETHIGLGDKFPDIEFYDLDGNPHRFSDYQGKWRLVDFWTVGCAPCRMALPELQELKEKYPETLEFISLSLDTESMWREQSKKLPLIGNNWNEGKEDYGMFNRLGLSARPSFLVVAPDGTIMDLWSGYSPGSLKQKMNFYLRPKGETEYKLSVGVREIKFPHYETNKTGNILDIERIEISDEGTKVYFSFVYYPNYWISISEDTYLTDSTGAKYPVIGSDGIVLGEHLFADSDGNGSFSITFEPIPEDVNSIDLHESSSNDGWSIKGIALKP